MVALMGQQSRPTTTNKHIHNPFFMWLHYYNLCYFSPSVTFFGVDFVDSSRFNRWNEQGIICFTWMKCSVRCVRRSLKTKQTGKGTMIGKVKVFLLYPCVLLVSFINTVSLPCANKHEESTGCFKERPTQETDDRTKSLICTNSLSCSPVY